MSFKKKRFTIKKIPQGQDPRSVTQVSTVSPKNRIVITSRIPKFIRQLLWLGGKLATEMVDFRAHDLVNKDQAWGIMQKLQGLGKPRASRKGFSRVACKA